MMDIQTHRRLRDHIEWFPPAESRISIPSIWQSLFASKGSLAEALIPLIGPCSFTLADSARSLLFNLLRTLKSRAGRRRTEVLVPGYTCYSVAAAIAKAGLTISVYDMDPHNFNPDMDTLRKAASEETLAILSQHLFGIPTSVSGIAEIARTTGAVHIEDAAQALGAFSGGRPLGTDGDVGLFSFGRGKPLPLGCGGMLISKDETFISDLEALPESNGLSRLTTTAVAQIVSKPLLYGIAEALPLHLGETHFEPGFHACGIPKLIRRLLTHALPGLESLNSHRRKISRVYQENLRPDLIFEEQNSAISVYTRFPLHAPQNKIPDELKPRGVRRMYPKALVDERKIRPFFSTRRIAVPGARQIAATLVTLPTHTGINKDAAKMTSRLVNGLMTA